MASSNWSYIVKKLGKGDVSLRWAVDQMVMLLKKIPGYNKASVMKAL